MRRRGLSRRARISADSSRPPVRFGRDPLAASAASQRTAARFSREPRPRVRRSGGRSEPSGWRLDSAEIRCRRRAALPIGRPLPSIRRRSAPGRRRGRGPRGISADSCRVPRIFGRAPRCRGAIAARFGRAPGAAKPSGQGHGRARSPGPRHLCRFMSWFPGLDSAELGGVQRSTARARGSSSADSCPASIRQRFAPLSRSGGTSARPRARSGSVGCGRGGGGAGGRSGGAGSSRGGPRARAGGSRRAPGGGSGALRCAAR